MQENVIKFKGDIFKIFISMYDCVDKNLIKSDDMEFYRKIFGNLKTSEDSKILSAYHQYFGVKKAIKSTEKAYNERTGKAGIYQYHWK